jgi:hypothetical protein
MGFSWSRGLSPGRRIHVNIVPSDYTTRRGQLHLLLLALPEYSLSPYTVSTESLPKAPCPHGLNCNMLLLIYSSPASPANDETPKSQGMSQQTDKACWTIVRQKKAQDLLGHDHLEACRCGERPTGLQGERHKARIGYQNHGITTYTHTAEGQQNGRIEKKFKTLGER